MLEYFNMEEVIPVMTGERYTHYSNPNCVYRVIAIGIMEATEEPAVIYQKEDDANAPIWVRALSSWLEPASSGERRFTKI